MANGTQIYHCMHEHADSPEKLMEHALIRATLCSLLLSVTLAPAAVLYYSDGSDISGYTGTTTTNGGTATSATPFVINGTSQGSYISATAYPRTDFATTIDASAAGTQEIWVAFLMRRDSGNSWAGGITLVADALPTMNDVAGVVGWNSNTDVIRLYNGGEGSASSSGFTLNAGASVAVLARFYEDGTSGLFDRADLYVDGDLADGINFGAALVTGYVNSSGANAIIGGLRLGADPSGAGETRSYDNIAVTTTQAEALALIPEPSTALLGGLGALALLRRRRND